MTKALFTFARSFDDPQEQKECTTEEAVQTAKGLTGYGWVWKRVRKHHHIVGSYRDGKAYNGSTQTVPATAESWDWFANNA